MASLQAECLDAVEILDEEPVQERPLVARQRAKAAPVRRGISSHRLTVFPPSSRADRTEVTSAGHAGFCFAVTGPCPLVGRSDTQGGLRDIDEGHEWWPAPAESTVMIMDGDQGNSWQKLGTGRTPPARGDLK